MHALIGASGSVAEADGTQAVDRLLMCAPEAYALKYEINDWMHLGEQPDLALAARQWNRLYCLLTEDLGAKVELVPQAENAPDMVFTANAGLVTGSRVLLSRFRHSERQVEVAPFRAWFEAHGFEPIEPPESFNFEGEGDALFAGETLVAGYLKRSDIDSHRWMADELDVQVLSVELIDGRWYHLDTAFFSPRPGLAVFYPGAFDTYGQRVIRSNFDTIEVAEEEALRFACNAVALGDHIVMPSGCPRLTVLLEAREFTVHPVEMSEFMKCGGAAKCLTLFLQR